VLLLNDCLLLLLSLFISLSTQSGNFWIHPRILLYSFAWYCDCTSLKGTLKLETRQNRHNVWGKLVSKTFRNNVAHWRTLVQLECVLYNAMQLASSSRVSTCVNTEQCRTGYNLNHQPPLNASSSNFIGKYLLERKCRSYFKLRPSSVKFLYRWKERLIIAMGR